MDLNDLKSSARSRKKQFQKFFKREERTPDGAFDARIHEAHEAAFACTDCLACANCCRTTGPLFTQKDIERIAGHLKLRPAKFVETYLRLDEDDDYVLQSVPCTFLDLETNLCSIYDVRPKACREYPHTDMRGQKKLAKLTVKNSEICPAVFKMLDSLSSGK